MKKASTIYNTPVKYVITDHISTREIDVHGMQANKIYNHNGARRSGTAPGRYTP
jgi:hypothetical protein